jgi:hypothetical protein
MTAREPATPGAWAVSGDTAPAASPAHRTDPAGSAGSEGTVFIPRRFRGPATSGNGGFVSGMLAAFLPDTRAVSVTLLVPPPLERPLTVARGAVGARLFDGDDMVAEAVGAEIDVGMLDPVSYEDALAAGERYAGLSIHPFPECFACGTDRAVSGADAGLRLRPGPVEGRQGEVAAAWVPETSLAQQDDEAEFGGNERGGATAASDLDDAAFAGSDVPAEVVWAALDCPGGWSVDLVGRPMVLGRMTAQIEHLPRIGEPHIVVGKALGQERRKSFTESMLFDADGRPLAMAIATWIEVDLSRVGGAAGREPQVTR